MQEEEEKHLAEFEKLMRDHRARPTVLLPLWNVAGFALGNVSDHSNVNSEAKFS